MSDFFINGNKVFVELENEVSNVPLELKGTLPGWLQGSLIRNGPIDVAVNGKPLNHWFDGLAMLHAFNIENGRIYYSNRFLRTAAYNQVFEKGSIDYLGFASDPCHSLFQKFKTFFSETPVLHNANINVSKIADSYIALTEIPLPVKFDVKTLETLGVFNFEDDLPKDKCWESAHPHHNPVSKETINYLIEYGLKSYYTVYKIDPLSSKRQILSKTLVKSPSYMHSFSITENYIVLTEYPFLVKPLEFLISGVPFIRNFYWKEELRTNFLVISRKTGAIKGEYKGDSFFAFHHANARETELGLSLDIVTYKDASIIDELSDYGRFKPITNLPKLERFHISFNSPHIEKETLLDFAVEFPRINEAWDGKDNQFLYLIDPKDWEEEGAAIYKFDLKSKKLSEWKEKGCFPGEAIFVAHPSGNKEDEGVILSVIFDKINHTSFLLVLEAETFKEIARAKTPHFIPIGLHGQFF